ncbi:MAG: glycosyltransferase family 4 protein [Chloroflexi bacterium]|nr:glycosyltransferase family 4 protein [Chloroflexota bacterium]
MRAPELRVAYLGIKGLPARGGAERVVEALVAQMPGLSIASTVYCDAAYTPADFELPGVSLVRMPALRGKYSRATSLDLFAACYAILRGRYDVIHLHNVEASFVLPLLRLRYPVIATSHGSAYWRDKWGLGAKRILRAMEIPFARFANIATSVSQKDARDLETRFGRPIMHIPNGVAKTPQCNRASAQLILDKHGLVRDQFAIFVAGRIEPTKGAHLAIEAINRLSSDVPLLIVGDPNHVPSYAAHLRQIASARICFEPLVEDQATLFGLMARATFLIFPSLVEAMAMVLLEAASLGVPIICSNIEENRQVMLDDALYFESENVASLTRQLEWGLANRESWAGLGRAAQARIQTDYAWDVIANRYAQLYRDLVPVKPQ